jgi:uncharacterized membrane protein (UPF0182 family)
VVPIEESLLYIQPLYLRAAGGRIPELKRVIVVYQNQIAMEETLDAALGRIFGAAQGEVSPLPASETGAAAPSPRPDATLTELLARARDHYQRAVEAQRQGDWSRYGEELKGLGAVLERLAPKP